jgi:hypothetical protein
MVSIKTIDFPDARGGPTLAGMDYNPCALETLVSERLTEARRAAHRLNLAALGRSRRRPLRVRLGETLIALGEWLRGGAVLAPQPS